MLGEELLLWRANMFLEDPRLPWHEDRHSRAFVRDTLSFSTLLAMDDLSSHNCTVFVPGSHKLSVPEKERKYGISAMRRESGNIRYAGRVAEEFCEPLPLRAGEAVLFHPHLLHASSSHVKDGCDASRERMIVTFRIATSEAELRDSAFPEERETRDNVLRVIRRSSKVTTWNDVLLPSGRFS